MSSGASQKKVLLLTNKFPYGVVETFIEAELEAIPEDIDVTVIPTQGHAADDQGRKVPDRIQVDDFLTKRSRIEYLAESFAMVFSETFWKEIKLRRKDREYSLRECIRLIGYLGRAKQIADAISQNYDLNEVVLYSYWATEASLAEKMLKKRSDVKCISRAHGTDVYDGHCVYGTIPAQREVVAEIDRLCVCSKNGRDYLRKKYPESGQKIECSYLGTKDYGWNADADRNEEFVVLSCSRLVPVKRVHLIPEALKKITDKAIHWIHIGDGTELERVKDAAKGLPENIRVTYEGNMPHEKVMEYYQTHQVDLFINVSESEGLPVSIMEVVSFGVPVVATDVGGTSEIVHAKTGDLIPKDFSPDRLTNVIRKYIEMDAAEYRKMRSEIRNYWERHYSSINNYRVFYRKLVED